MSENVNALIKVRNVDKQSVDEFIRQRFADMFSKANAKPIKDGQIAYKGGSIFRPYGFKAISSLQSTSDDATIVKLWGRPTVYPMCFLIMLLAAGAMAGLLMNPFEYWFCGILLLILIWAMRSERKSTAKKINQVLDEVKIRFS